MEHHEHQQFEADWWAGCLNTFGEEYKQLAYAKRMGLKFYHDGKSPFAIDMQGKSVLDIGGGPVSLLLKCHNVVGVVVDPCDYPQWVADRYVAAGIDYRKTTGEEPITEQFDEVWIYNCLQHTIDPAAILRNARQAGKLVRVFEWIENGVSPGHPHNLTESQLNEWLGGEGKVEMINENTAKGLCYYGIFNGV